MSARNLIISVLALSALPSSVAKGDWPMVAANPQRTSWITEEVPGSLSPVWYRQFEPYINYKTQVIAAESQLFISTAKGLYSINPVSGQTNWVYPTEFPLGNSPTYANGTLYVGGYDRKVHAVNAATGSPIWTFEAFAGFETNPLVINSKVYAGSRDGVFYCLDAGTGQMAWSFQAGGPIRFSPAYQNGVIYFPANDAYCYALDAATGALIWKSAKLPGAGFHSYWPVIYQDKIILRSAYSYRGSRPGSGSLYFQSCFTSCELRDVYPDYQTDPRGTLVGPAGTEPGDWMPGTPTVDCSRITEYFEQKPYRRTYIILNLADGAEYTFDYDADYNPEYAPFLWTGTHSGSAYPPVVGADGVLYQQANFKSDPWIAGGQLAGWKFGTPFISNPWTGWVATDEPLGCAAGGNLIYTGLCCDRTAGSSDITMGSSGGSYFGYSLPSLCPGYNSMYFNGTNGPEVYGSPNGTYSTHGTQNPPIPYNGKVYMIRGNALIAFDSSGGPATEVLPMVQTVQVQDDLTPLGQTQIRQMLENEIQKTLDAGHLRPGYLSTSFFDFHSKGYTDRGVDYWHDPADTLYTLLRVLPHLSGSMQTQLKSYIQNEFNNYPPYQIVTVGWQNGSQREAYITPPDVQADMDTLPASASPAYEGFAGWNFPPHNFYALAKYAVEFGGAASILNQCRNKLNATPADSYLSDYPYVHNAFIAGHLGYLELQSLAGEPESTAVRNELNRLLALRAANFSKDTPFLTHAGTAYKRTLNISRNFIHMVPELADYLRANLLVQVQDALDEYQQVAPGWFVTRYDGTYCEGSLQQPFDFHAIFQAKALILGQSSQELERYIDVPSVAVGDLFYIDNLVAVLDANSGGNQPPDVYAGPDQQITWPQNSVTLDADVSDDGIPDPPGAFTVTWEKVSGPGAVTFADSSAIDTTATFSAPGDYVLRLTADDSELAWYDEVTIAVNDTTESYLVAHWKLDETSGTQAADDSAENNDGNATGAVWDTGHIDGALHFYSDDDIVDVPDDESLRLQQMTLAAWIYPDTSLGSMLGSYPSIISKQDWTNNAGFLLGTLAADTDQIGFRLLTGAGTGDRKDIYYTETAFDEWVHVAATYDGAYVRLYRNGVEQSSSFIGSITINHNSYTVTLGKRFEGLLDDVRIYSRALAQSELQAIMNPAPQNQAPTVDAGSDQQITLPTDSVNLAGTVVDDGLPDPPAVVSVTWSKQSGPGTVSFANPNSEDTTATFSVDGVYVLRLIADDGQLFDYDEIAVTVNPQPAAQELLTNPGFENDMTGWTNILSTGSVVTTAQAHSGSKVLELTADAVRVVGQAVACTAGEDYVGSGWLKIDDPDVTRCQLRLEWLDSLGSRISLQNIVDTGGIHDWTYYEQTFSAPTGAVNVSFQAVVFTSSDGSGAVWFDDCSLMLEGSAPPPPQNQPPTVDVGPDQEITLPQNSVLLDASVTDDGLPNPPAALSVTWTKQSGPGTVTFADENTVDTTATFSTDGIYVLHLTAYDSDLSDYDELTVTVEPEPSGPSNLLSNPGFEAQMTDWQNILQTGSVVSTAQAHGGSYVLELAANAVRVVGQSVPCTAGLDYVGSGWLKIDDPDVTRCQLRVEWLDSLGSRISLQNIIDTGGVHDWTYYEQTFTAPTGAVNVSFQAVVFTSSDGSGYVWFDDCSLSAPD